MEKNLEIVLRLIEGTGPGGAYIAAGIVGLTLAIILIARFSGLYDGRRSETTKTDFLDRVVKQYEVVSKSEAALRQEADRIERENDELQDRQRELLTSVELLRQQLRRAIDLMKAVRDGQLQPADLDRHLKEMAQ